jgi:hypothetical protein
MNATNGNIFKGTVIKVPDATPGIVFANGQQHYFTLERVWKSPVAPAANQGVDVEFDAAGAITAVTVLDHQPGGKDKLHDLGGVAQEKGKEAAKLAQQGVGALAAKMGMVPMIVAVVVVIAFFFLPAAAISGGFEAALSFTFWGLLGIDFGNPATVLSGGGDHGIWAIIGVVAILAPFVAPFIRVTWSKFLNAAPLGYILIATIMIYIAQNKTFDQLIPGASPFSFSWGFYALVLAALVLGAGALKKPAA